MKFTTSCERTASNVAVRERQRLGGGDLDADARQPATARVGERSRRIDRRDVVGPEPGGQLGGQRSGTAADVERPLAGPDAGGVDQRLGERAAVAADVPVVRVRRCLERRGSRYVCHGGERWIFAGH